MAVAELAATVVVVVIISCIFSLSVSLDISRTLIVNYRWPAAIGLVSLWQPAKYV